MKKTILMIVVAVVIAGVSGGGVYLWQNNKTGSEKQVLSNQTCPVCTANQADATGYKEFRVGSFGITVTAEVPKGWSIYESPQNVGTDNLQALPTASFGKDDVAFGDMNWSQVDLYFAGDATHDPSARLVQEAKSGNYGTWSVETVGGIKADVVTFSLDNGQATKGGTGGKKYFINIPNNHDVIPGSPGTYGVNTVVIWKQALGDEEFENAFKYFIDTLKFTK